MRRTHYENCINRPEVPESDLHIFCIEWDPRLFEDWRCPSRITEDGDVTCSNTLQIVEEQLAACILADAAKYGKPRFVDFGAQSGPLGPPGSADLVLTARNVHNWTQSPGMADKVFADFFAVLKPGGLLAIEDHRADPRSEKDAGGLGVGG